MIRDKTVRDIMKIIDDDDGPVYPYFPPFILLLLSVGTVLCCSFFNFPPTIPLSCHERPRGLGRIWGVQPLVSFQPVRRERRKVTVSPLRRRCLSPCLQCSTSPPPPPSLA